MTVSGFRAKTVVGWPPEKGMNFVHLAELAAYSISTPYAIIGFLVLQRESLHQLVETYYLFWCLWCVNMTWGIALVLEHCAIGIEALTAGAEHGLWLHGSCFLLSNRYAVGALIDGASAKAGRGTRWHVLTDLICQQPWFYKLDEVRKSITPNHADSSKVLK
jgi:hypothetical protein